MNQSKAIKDPATFRGLSGIQEERYDSKMESGNETAQYSLHYSNLIGDHAIRCPTKSGNEYNCAICQRLRQVCPYSQQTQQKRAASTSLRQQSFTKSPLYEKNLQTGTFDRTKMFSAQQTPTKQNLSYSAKTQPRIIEQIVYYPVIHNILVPQQVSNPEKSAESNLSHYSSHYKYRHRSGTTNYAEPLSSPIRIEQYSPEILTPDRLKKLTQSMIN